MGSFIILKDKIFPLKEKLIQDKCIVTLYYFKYKKGLQQIT